MKPWRIIAWMLVSVLCAISFGFVTGLLHTGEHVNGLWLVTAAGCFHILAYRFYGRFLARRVMELDDQRQTPAFRIRDDTNYYPANKYVLFGHHFAAIAGAGPLLGPVLAAQFGFLPGLLWIVIGAVVAGAVQDFVILVGSLRRNGRSLPEIARAEIGWITGTATAVAVFFIVIVALAGLGLAVVNALENNPWGTFTIAMTIPIALLMGWYQHHLRPGQVGEMSLIGLVLLGLAVAFGKTVAQSELASWFTHDRTTLVWLLAGYGFLASVLPMWMLLIPRDYPSTFMQLGVFGLLAIGVFVPAPDIPLPRVTRFIAGGGPSTPSPLFPAINTRLSSDALAAMGFPVTNIETLSQLVEVDVAGRPGGAVSLAVGMAWIMSALPGMTGLMAYWYQFALLFEALFILTTIDAGTRVARYVMQEMGGRLYAPLRDINWWPGVIGSSAFVVGAWGWLIGTGTIATGWPMFGAANQLLGTVALCIGTTLLIKMGKTRYLWVTAIPMVFVGVITLAGCHDLWWIFVTNAQTATDSATFLTMALDAALVGLVAVLACIVLIDSARHWYRYLVLKQPCTTTEIVDGENTADGHDDDGLRLPAGKCC